MVALLNYMDRQMLSTMKVSMMIDIKELETAENFGRLMAGVFLVYGFFSPGARNLADPGEKPCRWATPIISRFYMYLEPLWGLVKPCIFLQLSR